MKITNKLILAGSLLGLITGSDVLANAGPEKPAGCDELAARIKKLEDRAVMSDTKKIILSGFVNVAELWASNGHESNTMTVSNDNEASRLNLTGTADFNDDLSFGATFETSFIPNSSQFVDVHQADTNGQAEDRIYIRKAELYADSRTYGKVTAGRGPMASDHTMTETDLSGTRVVATGANVWEIAGGVSFYNKTTGLNQQIYVKNPTNGVGNSAFANMDGLVRKDRIRYDSPRIYGVSISTSHGYQNRGDLFDVAIRFLGKFMGIKVAADLAYENDQSYPATQTNPNNSYQWQQINGSIGVLFPTSFSKKDETGLSLFFAGAAREWEAPNQKDGSFLQGKLGYTDQIFTVGTSSLAFDLAEAKDMARANADPLTVGGAPTPFDTNVSQKGKTWGVYFVQNVDMVASQLYAGYRRFTLKRTNSTARFDPVDAVMMGARVKL